MLQLKPWMIALIVVAIVFASLGISTQPASAATCTQAYTVKRGDTLSQIAAWYGVSWRYLADLNGIVYPWTIFPGQKLCISTSGSGTYPPQTVSWKDWSFKVIGVVEDSSVTIQTANFPDNMLYDATIGCPSCGISAVYAGGVDSGAGGKFKQVLTIPAVFAGVSRLWVRLTQVNNGEYFQVSFANSTVYPGGGTGGGSSTTVPTISIVSVARNSTVTIRTHNFPANKTFNVLMGPMGTKGVNGYNSGSFNSGNGSSQTLTFNIPSQLAGSYQVSIRTQSTTGGWFSYNWFYNSNAQ